MPPQTQPGLGSSKRKGAALLGGDPAGLETPGRTRPKEGPFGIAELKRSLRIAKILSFFPGLTPLGIGAFTEGRLEKAHKASTRDAVAATKARTKARRERSVAKRTGAKTVDQGPISPGEQERRDAVGVSRGGLSRNRSGPPRGDRRL